MRFDRRLLGVWITASVLVHWVWLTTAPTPRAPNKRTESLVEFSLETHSAPRVITEAPPAANLVSKVAAPAVKRRVASVPSAAIPLPATPQPSAAPATPAAPTLDLSPQAVARALPSDDHTETCSPRERSVDQGCDANGDAATAAAERALDQDLRRSARTQAYLAKREPPHLIRAADGSYLYVNRFDGTFVTFTARIGPDGEVRFTDASNVQLAPVPVSGVFDINAPLLGGPLHAAEKRWFLEQTVTLRRQIADAARSEQGRRAHIALERAFERIMGQALTPQQKRDAVLELWRDCSNDSVRMSGRAWLEALIRHWMPKGSVLGYDDAYLEQHNRGLPAQDRFDPYRGSTG